jgi:hypothetical protein
MPVAVTTVDFCTLWGLQLSWYFQVASVVSFLNGNNLSAYVVNLSFSMIIFECFQELPDSIRQIAKYKASLVNYLRTPGMYTMGGLRNDDPL